MLNFEEKPAVQESMPAAVQTKQTPMFAQYLSIKEEYPDALLFYRMGDFYELFFHDAEVASRELQIALTCRNPHSENHVPMCGVPHHAVEGYVSQLIDKGYKIAICEQMENPKEAKGLVKRGVIRVLSAGTALDDANLAPKGHNFLGAVYWNEESSCGGFAWVDFSTGQWSGLQSNKTAEFWQWVQKMAPSELILPESQKIPEDVEISCVQISRVNARTHFEYGTACEKICAAQHVADLHALALDDKKELTRACGALLVYLLQTQKQDPSHLESFQVLNLQEHLLLDEITERNLELFSRLDGRKGVGTLWHVLDNTITPMGGRLLQERLRHPWRDVAPIEATQTAVRYFFENDQLRRSMREALDTVYDIERLSTRIALNRATPKDFIALRQSLSALPFVKSVLDEALKSISKGHGSQENSAELSQETLPKSIIKLLSKWDNLSEYNELLQKSLVDTPPVLITEGGLFRAGFHSELDELLDLTEHGESLLHNLLIREQEATGINKMRLGNNRVFGYFFEIPKSVTTPVPEHFIRRQTLSTGERYTSEELKDLEGRLLSASDKRKNLEFTLFQKLRADIAEARPRILFMAELLASLDSWQGLAEAARRWNWVCPAVNTGTEIRIKEGRHPVVEAVQGASKFIPNDLRIDEARRLLLITGPNMAGKSTVLRQAAIICILAQIGSFVPAKEAKIGLCDRIFSRVGASDNLAQGQSTFMVEMMETARILRQASKRSLVILDEIGRGTSTFDGLALAWAVVEELVRRGNKGIRTLFATHYHELTALEGRLEGVHNMNIAVKEWGGEIVFLRRLVPGPSDRSYGIEVARLAGVPQPVVARAKHLLAELERKAKESGARGIENIDVKQTRLPGIPEPSTLTAKQSNAEKSALPSAPVAVEMPIITALRDLDTNALTPMEALTILHEWKILWGTKHEDDDVA